MNENAKWPGVPMDDTGETNEQGQMIYKKVISSEYTGLIFSNNGSSKTKNIFGFTDGTAYYIDGDTVGTWTYNPQ